MKAGSIRAVDPRVKLLLFAVTCLFVMNCTRMLPNLLLGCFIAGLLILGGKTGFALKALCFFLFGLFAAQPLGEVVHGAASAICMAICVLFRIMAPVIMAFTLVFQTTTVSQFIAAFQKMKLHFSLIIP